MKLVLHPGHSKCGSTTIQRTIIKNRSLLESHGYIIPDPQLRTNGDEGFNPNGETPRPFFRYAMEQGDLSNLKMKLDAIKRKYKDDNKIILISAENLVNQLGQSAGLNIHRLLRDYFIDCQVIYYIRRQDQFIMSAWQQWGYKQGLALNAFIKRAVSMRSPNYRLITSAFSNIYGKTNVQVVPLAKDSLHGGDLITDFFYRLGVTDRVRLPVRSVDNKSLNPYICEALAQVSHIFRDIHDESIKGKLEQLTSGHPGLFMRVDQYFPESERRKVMQCFEQDNIFISKNFMEDDTWMRATQVDEVKLEQSSHEEAASQAARAMTLAFSKLL